MLSCLFSDISNIISSNKFIISFLKSSVLSLPTINFSKFSKLSNFFNFSKFSKLSNLLSFNLSFNWSFNPSKLSVSLK